jgi:hypothetical protein
MSPFSYRYRCRGLKRGKEMENENAHKNCEKPENATKEKRENFIFRIFHCFLPCLVG